MSVVEEGQRITSLQRLGLSEPLIRLSSGELIHELFRDRCLGPPYYIYHEARTPDGPPLIPLWDYGDMVVGLWKKPNGIEFIQFSIESVDDYSTLSATEQGFWVAQFDSFYECKNLPFERLREAAASVEYRFLERQIAERSRFDAQLDTHQTHEFWLKNFITEIDHETNMSA